MVHLLSDVQNLPLTLSHLPPHPPLPPQSSMNRMASQALEKMETRKFKAKGKGQRESSCGASDSLSSSSTSDCAICLEKYIDGEVRKLSPFSYTSWFGLISYQTFRWRPTTKLLLQWCYIAALLLSTETSKSFCHKNKITIKWDLHNLFLVSGVSGG